MFYSKDILLRKDNSLGLIWLAATVGSHRSGINKLSKKEVNRVNIIKTCKDITQPPEPFALRFSSNLMVGVVRVYNQQYNFYCSDVNNMWIRLKRDLAAVQSENIELVNPTAKMELITFDYDLAIEQDITRPLRVAQDLELEVARNNKSKDVAIELGWASKPLLDLEDNFSDASLSSLDMMLLPCLAENRRKITLEEPSMIENLGSALDMLGAGLHDDALVGEDTGLYIDEDGNVVDYPPDVGFLALGDAPQVPGSTDLHVLRHLEALEKRKRDEGETGASHNADSGWMNAENGLMEDSSFDDRGQDFNADRDVDLGVPRKRARREEKHPRPQRLVIDDPTMLSRGEIIEVRDDYVHHQAELTRERQLKQVAGAAKTRIDNFLSRPHGVSDVGPDLVAFWMSAASRTIGEGAEELRNQVAVEEMRYADQIPLFSDIELEAGFMEEPLEPEIQRRQASADIGGTHMGVGISGFIGVGMEDLGRVKQSDCMPWSIDLRANIDSRSEDSSTGSDRLRQDFETIFDPATGRPVRRQRKASGTSRSSLELEDLEDQPLARRHRVQPGQSVSGSRSQDISRASSRQRAEGGDSDASTDAQNLFMDLAGHTEGVFGSQAQGTSATQERLVIERETVNFLEYVRSILREANAKSFSFADVVSTHRRRDVAASAFYHVLSLSTMNKMRPTQVLPYGDIHVELVE